MPRIKLPFNPIDSFLLSHKEIMLPSPILSLLTLKSTKPKEVEKIIFLPNPEKEAFPLSNPLSTISEEVIIGFKFESVKSCKLMVISFSFCVKANLSM